MNVIVTALAHGVGPEPQYNPTCVTVGRVAVGAIDLPPQAAATRDPASMKTINRERILYVVTVRAGVKPAHPGLRLRAYVRLAFFST